SAAIRRRWRNATTTATAARINANPSIRPGPAPLDGHPAVGDPPIPRGHRRAPADTLSQYTLTAQQHTRTNTRSPRTVAVLHPCPDVCTPFAGNSVAFLRRLGYFCGGTGGVCRRRAWKSLTPSAGGT